MNVHVPAPQKRITDVIKEYTAKANGAEAEVDAFAAHIEHIKTISTVSGAYVGSVMRDPALSAKEIRQNLLRSAWRSIYDGLNIDTVAPAGDRDRMKTMLENPPELTRENIREHFGDYLLDPRYHTLRGLAEAFSSLDPIYRSHSNVSIGVKGLPKRVIISNVTDDHWSRGYGAGRLKDVIDSLRAYRGQPKITNVEFADALDAARRELRGGIEDYDPATEYKRGAIVSYQGAAYKFQGYRAPLGSFEIATEDDSKCWRRLSPLDADLRLKLFANGNAHLFFEKGALHDINRALAEFYGDVLPDSPEEAPTRQTGTAVSADLQYYPTPADIVEWIMAEFPPSDGDRVLEPSCGCGRILDGLRGLGKDLRLTGIEYDATRVVTARANGHAVRRGNFLEMTGSGDFDRVYMNPPFAGRHYLKHISKAIEMLRPGGRLVAILPASAWYDHGELPGPGYAASKRSWATVWRDLPIGAFRESGTNVCTGVWTYIKPTN